MEQTVKAAHQQLIKELTVRVGAREARAMARLIFEDIFDWRPGRRDRVLYTSEIEKLQAIKVRLQTSEPVQYITEKADFYGLQLRVTPAVLIPRPETEELVEWILDQRTDFADSAIILDIGTGSGCIPLAIKQHWKSGQVHGLDLSSEALFIARENANLLGLNVKWWEIDILDEVAWRALPPCDIIISNPPYIPYRESVLIPNSVKAFEPPMALFVEDQNPLIFYHKIMQFALRQLKPEGMLFFECNEFNAAQVHHQGQQMGFIDTELRRDLEGKWRMWKGRKA